METHLVFVVIAAIFQLFLLVLFAVFADYDDMINPVKNKTYIPSKDVLAGIYPYFQDVQMMIFMGFGFLMTFLKKYGYSSVGFNFFISVLCLEWSLIMNGFLHLSDGKIKFNGESLIAAEFATATILISFGVVLGKTNPLQLLIMAIIEVPIFAGNEYLGRYVLKVSDTGDSIFVHTFGAYFGLGVTRMIYRKAMGKSKNEESVYHSDLFAMIGTLVLWVFWPSFNGGGVTGDRRHRAVINTFISLIGSTVATFIVSTAVEKGRINMVHVANATLAGGVAVGAAADLLIQPFGACIIGLIAGTISTIGYKFLTPRLNAIGFHDTCGVNNLHGMPGIIAGIVVAIASIFVTKEKYGKGVSDIVSEGRDSFQQAGFQLAALLITILIAGISGGLTGLLMKISPIRLQSSSMSDVYFNDALTWETPEDFDSEEGKYNTKMPQDEMETVA